MVAEALGDGAALGVLDDAANLEPVERKRTEGVIAERRYRTRHDSMTLVGRREPVPDVRAPAGEIEIVQPNTAGHGGLVANRVVKSEMTVELRFGELRVAPDVTDRVRRFDPRQPLVE